MLMNINFSAPFFGIGGRGGMVSPSVAPYMANPALMLVLSAFPVKQLLLVYKYVHVAFNDVFKSGYYYH
jgi:hypothetical protein